jgi:hypothetical protein
LYLTVKKQHYSKNTVSTSVHHFFNIKCCFVMIYDMGFVKFTQIPCTEQFASWQVKVRDGSTDWGWGVVVNVVKKPAASTTLPPALSASRGNDYIVDTLLHCSSSSNENGSRSKPCPPRAGEKGEMHVVS